MVASLRSDVIKIKCISELSLIVAVCCEGQRKKKKKKKADFETNSWIHDQECKCHGDIAVSTLTPGVLGGCQGQEDLNWF